MLKCNETLLPGIVAQENEPNGTSSSTCLLSAVACICNVPLRREHEISAGREPDTPPSITAPVVSTLLHSGRQTLFTRCVCGQSRALCRRSRSQNGKNQLALCRQRLRRCWTLRKQRRVRSATNACCPCMRFICDPLTVADSAGWHGAAAGCLCAGLQSVVGRPL